MIGFRLEFGLRLLLWCPTRGLLIALVILSIALVLLSIALVLPATQAKSDAIKVWMEGVEQEVRTQGAEPGAVLCRHLDWLQQLQSNAPVMV